MIKIEWTINGKKVNPRNSKNAIEAALFHTIETQVSEKLRSVRCPEHGSAPTVVATGNSLDDLTFTVSGCCEKLTGAALAAFK